MNDITSRADEIYNELRETLAARSTLAHGDLFALREFANLAALRESAWRELLATGEWTKTVVGDRGQERTVESEAARCINSTASAFNTLAGSLALTPRSRGSQSGSVHKAGGAERVGLARDEFGDLLERRTA